MFCPRCTHTISWASTNSPNPRLNGCHNNSSLRLCEEAIKGQNVWTVNIFRSHCFWFLNSYHEVIFMMWSCLHLFPMSIYTASVIYSKHTWHWKILLILTNYILWVLKDSWWRGNKYSPSATECRPIRRQILCCLRFHRSQIRIGALGQILKAGKLNLQNNYK